MPKEAVHTDGPFHAIVGWAADRDVQVGVEGDEGRSVNWLLYGPQHPNDDVLERLGRELLDVVACTDARCKPVDLGAAALNILDTLVGPPVCGVHATLDRGGCNRLIRVLRRARDAAYGADA